MYRYALAAGVLLACSQVASAANMAAAVPATAPMTSPTDRFVTLSDQTKLSSEATGLSVYNGDKADIGTIKDVAYDMNGVKAYIVSVGGFLGIGDHYVAVSPAALNVMYDTSDKKWHATMSATKDELKAAPEFKYTGRWNASQT